MSELLLPAGGLQAGLAAFEGGADAVYLGFSKFSARKEAKNFTFDEFAKISSYAKEHGKKVFVALNTLVMDSGLEEANRMLKQAAFIGCDGLLVQDLGIAKLAHERYPSLPLHASTQMAVHTIEGVKYLQSKGFTQVVLARELTLQEIAAIRKACPDIKLEVFIHGALCYGFSGLCMASAKLCHRSANCGACAQICRSYFEIEKDPMKPAELSPKTPIRNAWWFSMSDLDGTKAIKPLQEMGIDTLKVEGRMKGPAYTMAAAAYYRALLDGKKDTEDLRTKLQTIFARRQTGGWLTDYGREKQDFTPRTMTLGSTSYPGHRGVKIGTTDQVTERGAVVTLKLPLALRDGLLYFVKSPTEPIGTVQYGIARMFDAYRRPIVEAAAGQTVLLTWPENAEPPKVGTDFFVISRHDQTLSLLGKDLKGKQTVQDTTITLEEGKFILETRLDFLGKRVRKIYPLEMIKAEKEQDLEGNLSSLFAESDQSRFTLGKLAIVNKTGWNEKELFVPLSKIKMIRRDWYATLDYLLENYFDEPFTETKEPMKGEMLPARNLLSTSRRIPYLDIKELAGVEKPEERLYAVLGKLYLPLCPIMLDEEGYLKDLETIVEKLSATGTLPSVRFGLNNIAQVAWAKRHPECKVFCDIYLYLANHLAAEALEEELPNLTGGYLWLETASYDPALWPFEPTLVSPSFGVPLFISRSCFRHDSLLLSCEGCPHQGSWYLTQQDRKLHVMVKDCITVVTEA
jgi:putative protease